MGKDKLSKLSMLSNAKPRQLAKVQLPGRLGTDENGDPVYVYMRPIESDMVAEARAAAITAVMRKFGNNEWLISSDEGKELIAAETQDRILAVAMLSDNSIASEPIGTIEDISNSFLPSEREYLFEKWGEHQSSSGVSMEVVDIVQEVNELVELWGKGRVSRVSTKRYGTTTAHNIIFELVNRVNLLAQKSLKDIISETKSGTDS